MDQLLWLNKLKHIWRRKFAEINLYLDEVVIPFKPLQICLLFIYSFTLKKAVDLILYF